jgi:hypothetical protein
MDVIKKNGMGPLNLDPRSGQPGLEVTWVPSRTQLLRDETEGYFELNKSYDAVKGDCQVNVRRHLRPIVW